jgi:hypothetical protein
MSGFKIIPFSKEYARQMWETKKDAFGGVVTERLATGSGPCRVSLKPFKKGIDRMLLFSHSPFDISNAYNQPGPVFISADEVEPYADVSIFPPEIKNHKSFALTLVGYSEGQDMVYADLVGDQDIDKLIKTIFNERPDVSYLHARSAKACCYICKIERA